MILERVICGFQTGSDQAGVRAAKSAGLATGGWMPRGFLTEDGPRPEFAEMYGAKEHASAEYPPRTRANARDSDGTIWLGSGDSRGFGCTMDACRVVKKPAFIVKTRATTPAEAGQWIETLRIKVLNVAGNRESTSPGIGERAEAFLSEVFRILKENDRS